LNKEEEKREKQKTKNEKIKTKKGKIKTKKGKSLFISQPAFQKVNMLMVFIENIFPFHL